MKIVVLKKIVIPTEPERAMRNLVNQ